MAVQLAPRSFDTSAGIGRCVLDLHTPSSEQQRFAAHHYPRSSREEQSASDRRPALRRQGSESSLGAGMAQSCFDVHRPTRPMAMLSEEEKAAYVNLDVLGQPIPEELLAEQFADIQPAYVKMLGRSSEGESTSSSETLDERPPAPLPMERHFLDDLVIKKLQSQRTVKQTPAAEVQRRLGYEDTELQHQRQQRQPSSPRRAGLATSAESPKVAPRPIAKPRLSSTNSPSPSTRHAPPSAPAVVSSNLTPPTTSGMGSKKSSVRQLLKIDGHATEWFHGVITRKEADRLLRDQEIGTFLVRIGERHLGYSLSVRGSTGMKHFMITQRDENAFQLGTNSLIHATMHHLIVHFYQNALNTGGDVLVAPLDYTTADY